MAQSAEVLLPASEREAVDAFGDGSGITVVGGGTIVVPDLTYGRRRPETALVLRDAGLAGISRDGGRVVIGAMTRVADLLDGPEPLAARRARRRRPRGPQRGHDRRQPLRGRGQRRAARRPAGAAHRPRRPGPLGRRGRRAHRARRGLPGRVAGRPSRPVDRVRRARPHGLRAVRPAARPHVHHPRGLGDRRRRRPGRRPHRRLRRRPARRPAAGRRGRRARRRRLRRGAVRRAAARRRAGVGPGTAPASCPTSSLAPSRASPDERPAMKLVVNDVERDITSHPLTPLLQVLREELGITAAKAGCQQGGCGTCTVLVDGEPRRACLTPLVNVEGASVTTLEGVGTPDDLSRVQAAFNEHYAAQCGFCTPGFVLATTALLEENPSPDARGDPRGARRPHLPLHGLRQDHRRRGGPGRCHGARPGRCAVKAVGARLPRYDGVAHVTGRTHVRRRLARARHALVQGPALAARVGAHRPRRHVEGREAARRARASRCTGTCRRTSSATSRRSACRPTSRTSPSTRCATAGS